MTDYSYAPIATAIGGLAIARAELRRNKLDSRIINFRFAGLLTNSTETSVTPHRKLYHIVRGMKKSRQRWLEAFCETMMDWPFVRVLCHWHVAT